MSIWIKADGEDEFLNIDAGTKLEIHEAEDRDGYRVVLLPNGDSIFIDEDQLSEINEAIDPIVSKNDEKNEGRYLGSF